MFQALKSRARAILDFCSDAAHRRAVAVVLALVVAHFIGREWDVENVDTILSLVIAAAGAAWAPRA